MPNTGGFPWTGDIGTSSIAEIQALARSSGIAFSATSTYRPGDPGWHGTMNAVDMATSTDQMARLAAYLYQYSAYLLELIHSGGDGYFVKNGERVTASYFGAQTVSEHYDHVHCASTVSALRAASTGDKAIPSGADADKIPGRGGDTIGSRLLGCLPTTALIGLTTLGGIITWVR